MTWKWTILLTCLLVLVLGAVRRPVHAQGTSQGSLLNPTQEATLAAIKVVCPALAKLGDQRTAVQDDLFTRCGEILQETDELRQAAGLEGMARDEVGVVGANATETTVAQLQNVQARLAELRSGAGGRVSTASLGGWSAAPPAVAVNAMQKLGDWSGAPSSTSPAGSQQVLGWSGALAPMSTAAMQEERGSAVSIELDDEGKLGFFINGDIAFGEKDPTTLEPGYDFDSYNLTAGVDWRVGRQSFFGVALGYDTSDSELASRGESELEIDGSTLSLY